MTRFEPKEEPDNVNVTKVHAIKDIAALVIGVGAILIVAMLFLGAAGEWLAARVSPSDEKKWFGALSKNNFSEVEVPQEILDVWKKLSQKNFTDVEIGITCDKMVNAFALPGRRVILTQGLIENVKTDRGLAFVMSHELGHLQHRDHLLGMGRQLGMSMVSLLFGLSGESIGSVNLMQSVLSRSFSRAQESNADSFALNLVKSTFGGVKGSGEFFEFVAKSENKVLSQLSAFMSTHPNVLERLNLIRELEKNENSESTSALIHAKNPCSIN